MLFSARIAHRVRSNVHNPRKCHLTRYMGPGLIDRPDRLVPPWDPPDRRFWSNAFVFGGLRRACQARGLLGVITGLRDPLIDSYAWVEDSAWIGPEAQIGLGVYVGHGARIGPGARIGRCTYIGDRSEVGRAAVIGAHVWIGDRAWIGVNARVPRCVTIPAWGRVGVGSDRLSLH